MINWDRIKELRTEIGDEDFSEVVQIFLEEVEEGLTLLKACKTVEGRRKSLHFLKGSALNLGFQSFSSLCQTEEITASEGLGNQATLDRLVTCYEKSKRAFEAGLSS